MQWMEQSSTILSQDPSVQLGSTHCTYSGSAVTYGGDAFKHYYCIGRTSSWHTTSTRNDQLHSFKVTNITVDITVKSKANIAFNYRMTYEMDDTRFLWKHLEQLQQQLKEFEQRSSSVQKKVKFRIDQHLIDAWCTPSGHRWGLIPVSPKQFSDSLIHSREEYKQSHHDVWVPQVLLRGLQRLNSWILLITFSTNSQSVIVMLIINIVIVLSCDHIFL